MNFRRSTKLTGAFCGLLLLLVIPEQGSAQFYPHNTTTSEFTAILNKFGRIQTYDGSNGKYIDEQDRMIHYLTPQVGLNDSLVWHVWSSPDDPIREDTTYASEDSTDFARYLLTDDSFSHDKTMEVSMLIRLWKDENYGIVRYGVHNIFEKDSASAPEPDTTFKLAVNFRGKLYSSFGPQTLRYNSSSQRVYISGDSGVVALQPMDIDPVAVRFIDDDEYGTFDPDEDRASPEERWQIITQTDNSSTLNTGENGGWAFMNFGDSPVLASGDSTNFWMAFTHGDNREQVDRRLDSAVTRYNEVVTSTPDDPEPPQADRINLRPNYPNPFNPSTTIQFRLPRSASIDLSVYNVLGQKVETLINHRLQAGEHRVTFNGSGLASGVYFYRLRAEGFEPVTRRMTLIK